MSVARVARLLFVLVAAGCAGVNAPPPPVEQPKAAAPSAAASAEKKDTAPTTPSVAKPDAPVAKAPAAKSPASPAPSSAAPAKKEAAAPAPAVAAAKPSAPPLDLKSLETRLKETPAIGVFTKLSLKNQVDDLLDQFRAYYKGVLKTTLAELRRPYEMLLLKVLSLLQDADPPLAKAIVASREAIWGILSDPAKFSAV